ncbi:hypothetical protein [Natrinema amylolyticum]|uniref:hypothetical protein n=1 Tax=Natrinema amylolyticum TaxID=2878679 RepID=UPI001CFB967E|nr:hypothetical protein [Natrinema amylolyticum]
MSTQAPDEQALLETARNDPETVDVDTVVALLDADQGQVRATALQCLRVVATDDPARVAAVSDDVIERLDDEFPVAGSTATAVLASVADERPDAVRPALPLLVDKLDEHPPQTGHRAVRALTPLLEADPSEFVPAADALLDVVVDPPAVWAPESAELRDRPSDQREAVTNLLASRRDEIAKDRARVKEIREFAAHALVEVTATAPDAIADRLDELPPALSNDPPLARAATIDVVANVAADDPAAATPTVDALIDRLADDAEFVRAHAIRALGFAEATDAVRPLRELADEGDDAFHDLAGETADWLAGIDRPAE